MLYDSTKNLLQSILHSLETGDEASWDDQTESGNACLYEMHQMSGRHYKAYKSDNLNARSNAQSSIPEKLSRAMPHVRTMVIAIRHKDQTRAIESGRAALAEMNGISPAVVSSPSHIIEPKAKTEEAPAVRVDQSVQAVQQSPRHAPGRSPSRETAHRKAIAQDAGLKASRLSRTNRMRKCGEASGAKRSASLKTMRAVP